MSHSYLLYHNQYICQMYSGAVSGILEHMIQERISPWLVNAILTIALSVGVIWTLITGKAFLMPIALGMLLTLFMYPLSQRLRRIKFPNWLAITISCIIVFISVFGILTGIGFIIKNFVAGFPDYLPTISVNLHAGQEIVARIARIPVETQGQWLQDHIPLNQIGSTYIPSMVASVTGAIGSMLLSIIFSVFFLIYRDRIKLGMIGMLPVSWHHRMTELVEEWSTILPKYLLGLGMSIVVLAALNILGFWIIGIPNPLFWGFLTAFLNIIPYLGTVIGFGLVIIFSFLVKGPLVALYAVIMFLIVQFVDNNITTPLIAGNQIRINPLAAILGIIIAGNIWGIVGMIIALPLLGMLNILCKHIPALHPLGILISND